MRLGERRLGLMFRSKLERPLLLGSILMMSVIPVGVVRLVLGSEVGRGGLVWPGYWGGLAVI